MAKKELTITVRARSLLAKGLKSARAELNKFGGSVANAGKAIAKGFLAGAAALVAFGTKAVQGYAVQEEAEKSLSAAMSAHGEAADKLMPALKKVASAIQDETGAADEATLAGMAKMRMLGVQTSKLGEAAKAVIALKSVGLEEAAAQKAVAMAMQGNYDMLKRYVPALRETTDKTEQANIVNDLFAKGYEQQAEKLDTVSGQYNALKGRIGDLLEVVGESISKNAQLTGVLKRAGDAVKAFGERVQDWAGSGGVAVMINAAQVFFEELVFGFKRGKNSVDIFFGVIRDSTAFQYLASVGKATINAIIAEFQNLKANASAVWNYIKKAGTEPFKAPSIAAVAKANDELVEAIKGNRIKETGYTKKALEESKKLHQDHNAKLAELDKKLQDQIRKHDKKKSEENAADLLADQEMALQEIEDKKKKAADDEDKRIKARSELEKKEAAKRIAEIEKRKAKLEQLANTSIADALEQAGVKKEADKQWEKDQKKAEKLIEKRGRKWGPQAASKKQKEKEAAFLGAVKQKQEAIGQLEKDNKVVNELKLIRQDITKVMRGG
ncbi:MAG: hypothetical protein M0P69_14280 [Bacteroidales bacterium]|nr:hypothetical protein [Bacteroidales bacterium]